jgi:lipoprotein-releasing system permease protein
MNSNLILNIALRLLYSRMKQSVVAAVGVTFGVAMFVTLLSFMNGLNQMLDNLMLNRTPHVLLYNEVKPSENQPLKMVDSLKNNVVIIGSLKPKDRGKEIYNALAVVRSLKQDARVFDVAPKINAQVFFNSGSIEIAGVVNGIDVLPEEKLYKISDYIIEGEVKDLLQQNTIIIGKGLSEKMMLTKGDAV